MRIFDENWNEIFDHPLFDAMDELNKMLSEMKKEERLNVFNDMMYREPLKYLQEVNGITYIIRTHFNEDETGKVIDTINRLMEKQN